MIIALGHRWPIRSCSMKWNGLDVLFKSSRQKIVWKFDLNFPNICFRLLIWPMGHREAQKNICLMNTWNILVHVQARLAKKLTLDYLTIPSQRALFEVQFRLAERPLTWESMGHGICSLTSIVITHHLPMILYSLNFLWRKTRAII
jgi:hypothetical protein